MGVRGWSSGRHPFYVLPNVSAGVPGAPVASSLVAFLPPLASVGVTSSWTLVVTTGQLAEEQEW